MTTTISLTNPAGDTLLKASSSPSAATGQMQEETPATLVPAANSIPAAVQTSSQVPRDSSSSSVRPSVHSDPGQSQSQSQHTEILDPVGLQKPHPVKEATLDPRRVFRNIPPEHSHRTLVLCFDGTGDQFDADNSNIVQLFSMLKKDDRNQQMVYYQAGIGTYTSPKIATPFMTKISQTLDEMVAWNLDAHVMDGYEFLMRNYISGDRICIFGFSRGAFTARSLAGMIHKVGLLPADNFQQIPFAYKMYTRADDVGWQQSNAFKKAFSIDVTIEFIGVWDTVDSVGIIPKRLPFTTSNTIVRTFRHAIALDERRAKFKANCWNRPTKHEACLGLHTIPVSSTGHFLPESPPTRNVGLPSSNSAPPSVHGHTHTHANHRHRRQSSNLFEVASDEDRIQNLLEKTHSRRSDKPTDVEEVWFSGSHTDVGGGSVKNNTRYSLARISLRWMVRECFKASTGIMFDTAGLREIGLDPCDLFPFVTHRPPPLSPKATKGKIQPISEEDRSPSALERLTLPPTLKSLKDSFMKMTQRDQQRPSLSEKSALLAPRRSTAIEGLPTTAQSPPPPHPPQPPPIGTEEQEELRDALSPVYDQLKVKRWWWILEVVPMQFREQKGGDKWVWTFKSNMARPRKIPKVNSNGVKVHRSVRIRMEAEAHHVHRRDGRLKPYKPKAKLANVTWVD